MGFVSLLGKLRQQGALGWIELCLKNIRHHRRMWLDARLDRRFGLNTSGHVALEHLEIDSDNRQWGVRYEPSSYNRLYAAFSNLPKDLSQYTFVDYGSGLGRVLAFASQYNFKKIVGVEFSRELYEASRRNINAPPAARRVCADITLVHLDATLFEPPAGPLVLYFFDPFREVVMSRVLENIRRSYLAQPRKIYVMYLAPYHEDMFNSVDVFTKLRTEPLPFDPTIPFQFGFAMFETQETPAIA